MLSRNSFLRVSSGATPTPISYRVELNYGEFARRLSRTERWHRVPQAVGRQFYRPPRIYLDGRGRRSRVLPWIPPIAPMERNRPIVGNSSKRMREPSSYFYTTPASLDVAIYPLFYFTLG